MPSAQSAFAGTVNPTTPLTRTARAPAAAKGATFALAMILRSSQRMSKGERQRSLDLRLQTGAQCGSSKQVRASVVRPKPIRFFARPHGTEREAILTVHQPYRVTLRRVHWYNPNDLAPPCAGHFS